jgi:hypothetical protein
MNFQITTSSASYWNKTLYIVEIIKSSAPGRKLHHHLIKIFSKVTGTHHQLATGIIEALGTSGCFSKSSALLTGNNRRNHHKIFSYNAGINHHLERHSFLVAGFA